MYNLSSIAHAALQNLKQQTTTPPSRSQLLELLAAYCGYKTYAAFKADATIHEEKIRTSITDQPSVHERLAARLAELKLSDSLAVLLAQSFNQQFSQLTKLEPKVSLLRIAQYLGIAAGEASLSRQEIKSSYAFLLNRNDPEPNLLRYVWQSHELEDNQDDDEDDSGASAYWYEQRKAGNQLSAAATQWANAYERQLAMKKRRDDFLSAYAGATLAKPNAIELITQHAEPNICCYLDASYLLSLFESLPIESIDDDFYYDWHYLETLQRPFHESLVELAEGIDKPIELWALYFFAKDNNVVSVRRSQVDTLI